MDNVTLSIIITLYNRRDLVLTAINSVIGKLPNTEILVIDDGSTDHPLDVLQEYIDRQSIRYFYKENGGAASAKNYGAKKASGKYILFLDSDDYIFCLETLIEIIEKNLDFDLFTHKKIMIKRNNSISEVISKDIIKNYYFYLLEYPLNYPDKPTYIFNKDKFLTTGGFNESHKWGDALLFWRIYLKNCNVYSFNRTSYLYDLTDLCSISRNKHNDYYKKVLTTISDSYSTLRYEINKNGYTSNWCIILLLLSIRTLSIKKIFFYLGEIIKNNPMSIISSICYIIQKRKNRD